MEAHNRIFFFLQQNADVFNYVEHWHVKHKMKYKKYNIWIENIKEKLTKHYIIENFPEYSKYYTNNWNYEESDEDEDNFEKADEEKENLINLLEEMYPSIAYYQSGTMYEITEMVFGYIIIPLLKDDDFLETELILLT